MTVYFANALAPVGDFGFIAGQRGSFSFLGIGPDQVRRLKEDHGIYMLGSSRINVAGLNDRSIPEVAKAIRAT